MLSAFEIVDERGRIDQPCALLLGGFDGLHVGHASLLKAAKDTGLPVAITSIGGLKRGGDLFTREERRTVFREAGISYVLEFAFTEEFRATPARAFIKNILERVNAKALFCGADFRFGKGAAGTPALLKHIAPCPVNVLPLTLVNGEKAAVSSVKELLASGKMQEANALCGGFFLQGEVEHGRQVGRTYGFPTLNLTYPDGKFPMKEGVYGGTVKTSVGEFSSIIHFGARPTFGVQERKVEAYLKDFSGDLYGATVRVEPKRFLREICTFSSQEALKEQLKADILQIETGI
ncbi:MAG: hypothetical protein K2N84_00945 [Clostridia bacterium]|nr:hypothetical protein [Clostridia bacterium]